MDARSLASESTGSVSWHRLKVVAGADSAPRVTRVVVLLLSLVVLLASLYPSVAKADTEIEGIFDSLPSANGWTYFSLGASEGSIFSVNKGRLTQNTVPGPFSNERYELLDAIDPDPSLPYTVTMRARVLQESGSFAANSFGFGFGVGTPGDHFGIGIGTSRIEDLNGNVLSTTIDGTKFHTYKLKVRPGVGYEFYVDKVLIATGLPRTDVLINRITFGDLTNGAGALAEVKSFGFSQGSD